MTDTETVFNVPGIAEEKFVQKCSILKQNSLTGMTLYVSVGQISANSRILFYYTDNLHQFCRMNKI